MAYFLFWSMVVVSASSGWISGTFKVPYWNVFWLLCAFVALLALTTVLLPVAAWWFSYLKTQRAEGAKAAVARAVPVSAKPALSAPPAPADESCTSSALLSELQALAPGIGDVLCTTRDDGSIDARVAIDTQAWHELPLAKQVAVLHACEAHWVSRRVHVNAGGTTYSKRYVAESSAEA